MDSNGKEISPIAFQIRKAMLREEANLHAESTSGVEEEMELHGDGEYKIFNKR